MGNLLIKNGRIVYPEGIMQADIKIIDGIISEIGISLSNHGVDEIIEAKGRLIFPGIIDEHVHMREPGLTYKDDFTYGTKGAAAGGVTTVIEMPNTLPPVDSPRILKEKASLLEKKAHVDFGLLGVIHQNNINYFEDIVYAGALGFKIFLGPTTGNIPSPSLGDIYEALIKSAKYNTPIAFHAENKDLVDHFTQKIKESGRNDYSAHTDARPPICEVIEIEKLVRLTKETSGKTLIVHMSAWEGVEIVKKAKYNGIRIYSETNPHYLRLTVDDYKKYRGMIKVNPPIRDSSNRKRLLEYLKEGAIDTIASDHAPHSREEKEKDVWNASSGMPGVQTLFPVMLDMALNNVIPITLIPRTMSRNPAIIFNIYHKKGDIKPGYDGDLVIVNPNDYTIIEESQFYSKNPLNPFIGVKLKGKIEYTILRGNIVSRNNAPIGKPIGNWIRS